MRIGSILYRIGPFFVASTGGKIYEHGVRKKACTAHGGQGDVSDDRKDGRDHRGKESTDPGYL